MRGKRIALGSVTLFLLLAAGGAAWLLGTEAGLDWAWRRAAGLLDQRLSATGVAGRLAGPIRIEGLRYADPGMDLTVAAATLEWRPAALLGGRLEVRRLAVDGVDLHLHPQPAAAKPAAPPSLPHLPLVVALDQVEVSAIRLVPPGGQPLTAERLQGAARLGPQGLALERLELRLPEGRVEASGTAGPTLGAPLDLKLNWSVRPTAWREPTAGEATLAGEVGHPRLAAHLSGAVQGQVTGAVEWAAQPLRWSLAAEIEPLALRTLADSLPEVTVGGKVGGGGEIERFNWQGTLELSEPAAGAWHVDLAGERDGPLWKLPHLALAAAEGAARAAGNAVWDSAGDRLDGAWEWHDRAWPPAGAARVRSGSGRLGAHGALDDLQLTSDGEWRYEETPPGRFELRAAVKRDQLLVQSLAADWLNGHWQGDGQLAFGAGAEPQWQAHVAVAGVDPSGIAADWPGAVDAELRADGRLGPAPTLQLALERLGGTLRGEALAGHGTASLADGKLALTQVELRGGDARLSVDGELAEHLRLAFDLKVPRMERLLPEAHGSVTAEGRLEGSRDAPRLTAKLDGAELAFAGRSARRLTVRADLSGEAGRAWSLDARAQQVELGGPASFAGVDLTAQGSAASHRVRLSGQGADRSVLLALEGGLASGGWSGRISEARLSFPGVGKWEQAAPAKLAVAGEAVTLGDWCWRGHGQLCVAGGGDRGQGEVRIRLTQLPLAVLAAVRPELQAKGELNGSARVGWAAGKLSTLQAEIAGEHGALIYKAPDGESLTAPFTRLAAAARQERGDLITDAELLFESGGRVKAGFRVAGWQAGAIGDRPLQGELAAEVGHLGWLAPLLPRIAEPRGKVAGQFTVAGRVGAPLLHGRLLLTDAGLRVPDAGIALTGVEITVASGADGALHLTGQAHSGPGLVHLTGRIVPPPAGWRAELGIKGERFLVAALPPARVLASPDLTVTATREAVEVGGTITLPEAEIHLPEIPRSARNSEDLVVVDRPAPEAGGPRRVKAEVRLVLGDKVQVDGFGFRGRLTGALTVIERPGSVPRGHGELRVADGRYEAYGQGLAISEGRLLFAGGPLTDPGLSFKAVRKVEQENSTPIQAGVTVTGTARRPQMRLFSDPAMDDSEVLSYLLLGHSLRTASKQEAGGLAQAALGLVGGERVARQIAGQFGIDTVQVGGGTKPGETAVALGKYLSPRLYVQYMVGVAEAASAWRLRYRWTDHWSLEAQTGPRGGADLLFTIER